MSEYIQLLHSVFLELFFGVNRRDYGVNRREYPPPRALITFRFKLKAALLDVSVRESEHT